MIYTTFLAEQSQGSLSFFLMIGGMFIVMYFFMIRPQMKKAKDEKKFQADIKVGDRVVTTAGIHGKIAQLTDTNVIIETGAGKITFEKSAISREFTSARYGTEATK